MAMKKANEVSSVVSPRYGPANSPYSTLGTIGKDPLPYDVMNTLPIQLSAHHTQSIEKAAQVLKVKPFESKLLNKLLESSQGDQKGVLGTKNYTMTIKSKKLSNPHTQASIEDVPEQSIHNPSKT